jgi:branched-chain amino acid transport system ATP-binding protein
VLLLDEPAAGMNYGEAEGLKKQIRWLRDEFGSPSCWSSTTCRW